MSLSSRTSAPSGLAAALPDVRHIATIGNYPPRRCGIATYTFDVRAALLAARPDAACDVVAMRDTGDAHAYPAEVGFTVRHDVRADYLEAARRIEASGAEVILLQHEFGIFGGPAGEHVLTLLDHSSLPVVSVLHTVLSQPDPDQRRVFDRLIARSDRLIVMAERGRDMLRDVWGVADDKVVVIPHGAPDEPLVDTAPHKAELGFGDRELLFTFGLLSPGKGIETAIRAMPAVVAARPQALYLVLGATHPHLLAREGERYREGLKALAAELGVGDHVRFVDEYTDTPRLLEHLRAADLYVTPYLNEAQSTSGTLAYAAALGKPIVSTPYWHAQELLADGRGVLIPFGDPAAIAAAAIGLLSSPAKLTAMRERVYAATRGTVWSALAENTFAALSAVRSGRVVEFRRRRAARPTPRPQPSLAGVRRMTDSCGMLQHSLWSLPDRNHGYCVDDNARALILMHRLPGAPDAERLAMASSYASFLAHAWNDAEQSFRNFMSYERAWLESRGSEDSNARSFWAVCSTAVEAHAPEQRRWAQAFLPRLLPAMERLTSPRAEAFTAIGLALVVGSGFSTAPMRELLRVKAERLASLLDARAEAGEPWFEAYLSYDNARLPEALIRAGVVLGDMRLKLLGFEALLWLCRKQTAPSGCFRAVPTEDFGRTLDAGGLFDQQPLEAWAAVDACQAAIEAGGDAVVFREEMERAFAWYHGRNDLGVSLAEAGDGECFDGLTWAGANQNQGAESVLAFQLASCTVAGLTRSDRPRLSVGDR